MMIESVYIRDDIAYSLCVIPFHGIQYIAYIFIYEFVYMNVMRSILLNSTKNFTQ